MNIEELEKTWDRQTVRTERAELVQLGAQLAGEARLREARLRRVRGIVIFVFAMGWAVALGAHFTGIKPFTRLTFGISVVNSLFYLGFFFRASRSVARMRHAAIALGGPVMDSTLASLRAVEQLARDCRLVGLLLPVWLLLNLGFVALQYRAGSLPALGVTLAVIGSVLLSAAVGLTLRRYYQHDLLPRCEELRALLHDT